jgi:hypothetical protein
MRWRPAPPSDGLTTLRRIKALARPLRTSVGRDYGSTPSSGSRPRCSA